MVRAYRVAADRESGVMVPRYAPIRGFTCVYLEQTAQRRSLSP
jgi:hypothetical protein